MSKYEIIKTIGERITDETELKILLENKLEISCYDGFEPSGRMHIAQGVLKAINVNKLTSAGCVFKFWVADFFAMLNHKMGGDLAKIRLVGEYMVEVWKACGMNMDNVQFLWASEEINKQPHAYTHLLCCTRRPIANLFPVQQGYPKSTQKAQINAHDTDNFLFIMCFLNMPTLLKRDIYAFTASRWLC